MKRIVLFESEPFLEKFLGETLKNEGHEVFVLEDPLDSDFMIKDIAPELIFYSYDSFSSQWEAFKMKYSETKLIAISTTQIPGVEVLLKPISRVQILDKVNAENI